MQFTNNNFFTIIQDITVKYQEALMYLSRDLINMSKHSLFTNNTMNEIISNLCSQSISHPEHWITLQTTFSEKLAQLITSTTQKALNSNVEDIYIDNIKNRRFSGDAWKNNLYFNFIKQFYLMSSEIWGNYIETITRDLPQGALINFLNKQLIDGLCPTNFVFTNPAVLQASIEQNGQNLLKGLDNLLNDLKKYHDHISISNNDNSNFQLGKNLATTPGKVIFKNELIELLAFQTKDKVHKIPVFIVPAWINKYYILDLSAHNSFIRWLTDNNFQVFVVSWVNPDETYKDTKFEDYCMKGIVEACEFLRKEFKIKELNAIGYCLGGTLLSMALCYMKAKNINIFKSATFLTTLLDFSTPGQLGVFINDKMLKVLEKEMNEVGYLDGRYLSSVFSILKANELIWHFMVNNYLMGKTPDAFDILYWNSDSTNLPAEAHSYYLRNMYLENNLTKPNKLFIQDVPINLEDIDIPTFFLGAKEDHIAPAVATFQSFNLLKNSDKKFCLTTSGHIVGVINPPGNSKYSYWLNDNTPNDIDYENWTKTARKCEGSWWPMWLGWLKKNSGKQIEDLRLERTTAIEPAPGSYVKRRL